MLRNGEWKGIQAHDSNLCNLWNSISTLGRASAQLSHLPG